MKKIHNFCMALAFLLLLFVSCESTETEPIPDTTEETSDNGADIAGETNQESSDDYTFDDTITYIVLNGNSVSVTGSGVTIESSVAIITAAGTYSVSGNLTDGQIVVDAAASDKVKVILKGVNIGSSSSAPFYVKSADKVIVHLSPDTENSLSDASSNEAEGTLYSVAKLSLFGTGSLTVQGNADGGIASVGGLIIKEGIYKVKAAGSTIRSDKNLIIDGGIFTLNAGNDGIHGEESLTFNGGDILITQSEEGVESAEITINSGTSIRLTSTDDGLNASSGNDTSENHFYMKGGYLYINAAGDGIDSNGYIDISGGVIVVNGPSASGNGAIDYDRTFNISSGLLVAVGSSGMGQAPSQSSTQNSIKVTFSSAKQASQLIHLQDSNGNAIVTFKPAKSYQSLIISSPSLVPGNPYSVYLGGSSTGIATNGLYEGGVYTPGTQSASFAVSGSVTSINGN